MKLSSFFSGYFALAETVISKNWDKFDTRCPDLEVGRNLKDVIFSKSVLSVKSTV